MVSLGLGGGVGREANKMAEGSGLGGMGQRWQGEVEGGDGLRFWKGGKQTWGVGMKTSENGQKETGLRVKSRPEAQARVV